MMQFEFLHQGNERDFKCEFDQEQAVRGQRMEWVVGFATIVGLGYLLLISFRGKPKFWRLVRRHPDLAMRLFAIEAIDVTCIIDAEAPTPRYNGPFCVTTGDGVTHEVYIRSNGMRVTQARVARSLYAAEGRLS
jgi:hypothetical protein